jgi:hypothetical protein
MSDEFKDIQEAVFDYFRDIDDKTISAFIECHVFKTGTTNTEICTMNEKFLEDNGLKEAYLNQHHDETHPGAYFLRTSLTQRSILQQVNVALLTLAFNRFRSKF